MATYLVEVQYKTDKERVLLVKRIETGENGTQAWAKVTRHHTREGWEIIGGYMTADPYKVSEAIKHGAY
jgi:hypothetical protein